MSQRPVPPRGMRDLLPREVLQRRHLLERILSVYERYGFQQIETPLVEDIDRLLGSEGGENEKLLFKILERGLDWPLVSETEAVDLGLRYDLTVPLARFYATHSNELLSPFKAIQTGPVFRAERPQKGRYRQFTQCDIDVIGESSVAAEVELIAATSEALQACEVGEFTIRLNDRRVLEALVFGSGFATAQLGVVLIALDKLDKIGFSGVADELAKIDNGKPTRALIATLEGLAEKEKRDFLADSAPAIPGLDDDVVVGLDAIVASVAAITPWVKIDVDATIVRGMGYYTGAIFEVAHAESSGSLGGGGRYDRMIGKLSGIDAPACGFSIGFERLWNVIGNRIDTTGGRRRIVLLYPATEDFTKVATAAARLRNDGDTVFLAVATRNRKNQLARYAQTASHWAEFSPHNALDIKPLTKDEN